MIEFSFLAYTLKMLNLQVLRQKHEELEGKMSRLENGLEKLRVTAVQVSLLPTFNNGVNKLLNDDVFQRWPT